MILTGRGGIVSTAHVATPPAGFDYPIEVALVDLVEGPRLFALLLEPAPLGTIVQAVPAPVREGHPGFLSAGTQMTKALVAGVGMTGSSAEVPGSAISRPRPRGGTGRAR